MRTLVALATRIALAPVVPALEYATPMYAQQLVRRAAAFVKKEGRAKALAAFNDRKGAFAYRDLYVFAYGLDGTCLAHPTKPERVGKNNLEDVDPDGKKFVRERIEIVKQKGKGWQEYKFHNPATNRIEQKVAYFELVDGVLLVAGAYKK
jgi:signal transduction histidine kinase